MQCLSTKDIARTWNSQWPDVEGQVKRKPKTSTDLLKKMLKQAIHNHCRKNVNKKQKKEEINYFLITQLTF